MTEFNTENERLEAYFDRRIIEVERNALEEEARDKPDFAQKVRTQREALIALDILGNVEAAKEIHEVYQELKKERARKRSRIVRFASGVVVAAALGSLAVFGPWESLFPKANEAAPVTQTVVIPTASELVTEHIQSSPFQQAVDQLAPASGLSEVALAAISPKSISTCHPGTGSAPGDLSQAG